MKIIKKTLSVDGMSCNHCKMSVEKALSAIEVVQKVEVNLEKKCAVIEANKEIKDSEIKRIVEEIGFTIK